MNPYTVLVPRGFYPPERSPTAAEHSPHGLDDPISRLVFRAVQAIHGVFAQTRENPDHA